MAITKVGAMTDPPVAGDYSILQAKLDAYAKQVGNQGMILTEWTNTTTAPKIAMGSYISHGGTLFVVDTEDYVVTTAINGYQYFRVWASGDTLIIDTVSSVVGYSWNAIYNGLYDVSGNQILPYQLNMNAVTGLYEKRKITNLMQGAGFVTVDYLGAIIGQAISVASVAVSGAITDKNGNEVLAMKIETKSTTGSFIGTGGFYEEFSVTFAYSNDIQGIVYAEAMTSTTSAYPNYETRLYSYSVTTNSITLTFRVNSANSGTTYFYSCVCTCAID